MARPLGKLRIPDAEIARLYRDEDWSAHEIAAECGCSRDTITRRLRRLGVEVRGQGAHGQRPEVRRRILSAAGQAAGKRRREAADERARDLLPELRLRYLHDECWLSIDEITAKVGVPRSVVVYARKLYGLEPHPTGMAGCRPEVKAEAQRKRRETFRRMREEGGVAPRRPRVTSRSIERQREAGWQAECPHCERPIWQERRTDDGWASCLDRLARHLELDHGLHEDQAATAALDARYIRPRRAS